MTKASSRLILSIASVITAAALGVAVNLGTGSSSLALSTSIAALAGALATLAALVVSLNVRRGEAGSYHSAARKLLGTEDTDAQIETMILLETLAQDDPGLRQDFIDRLCDYLRILTISRNSQPRDHIEKPQSGKNLELSIIFAQSIITRHLAESSKPKEFWQELSLNLRDTVLLNLDFSHCKAVNISFERSRFVGYTSFKNAYASGYALFSDTRFDGFALFDEMTCARDAAYDNASFSDGASFVKARFGRSAIFARSRFRGGANFSLASVNGPAWFDQARFDSTVNFDRASFSGVAEFNQASFAEDAMFTFCHFAQDVEFDGASFQRNILLDGSTFTGKISFSNTRFNGYLSTAALGASAGFELSRDQYNEIAASQERVASQGDPRAMRNLAQVLTESGRTDEAERWLRRAADSGDITAMSNLGALHTQSGRTD
jgi:hypothetical protein